MKINTYVIIIMMTGFCVGAAMADSRPNILFILADDFGFNDIGYHASEHESAIKTPHLDFLAENGIKLENYYVQPICSPTRSQLMSGRYQIHTGLQHGVIRPSQPNALPIENKIMPEQLKNCGYDTHMVGKWHLGFYEEKFLPWKRGFNSYFGYLTGAEDYYTHERCFNGMCGEDMWDSEIGPVNNTWGEYSAHLFARKAIEAIDKRDSTKPLFMYLAYQSVHGPLQVPDKYTEMFKDIKDKARRTYAGMVLALDESVYNVTQHLAKVGILDNTIIVFSTDNGGQTMAGGNNWPLRGRKATLWEGGVRGAGFMYGKLLEAKCVTHKGLLHVSDWFPTLLQGVAMCSTLNGTQPLDGYNQWDAIRQKESSPRTEILHNIDPLYSANSNETEMQNIIINGFDIKVHAAIRSGPWKLLTGNPGFDQWVKPPESEQNGVGQMTYANSSSNVMLFNIENDPYEHNEVSEMNPTIVQNFLSKLAKYNSTAVPVRYPPMDAKANPKMHGGFWSPWMK
uniref:arylsulfatase J-like n=1 Tax=Styela clava TaxID=7725 RepID=UPI001939D6FD|nr:arylsulfatase J-like [Styela clava]